MATVRTTTTEKTNTIKVWMAVSIEIDPAAHRNEYGNQAATIAEIKQDVRDSVASVLSQTLFPENSGIVVSVTAK